MDAVCAEAVYTFPPQLVLHVLCRSRVCGSRVHLKKKEKEKKKKRKIQIKKKEKKIAKEKTEKAYPRLSDSSLAIAVL